MKDRNGIVVVIDSFVKVHSLDPTNYPQLDEKELKEVMSMVGETLQIYDIDEYDQAWVVKEWWISEGEVMSHSVALCSNEFEIQPDVS